MAPRETPKPVTKVQRAVKDMQNIKGRSSLVGAIKKPKVIKTVEKTPLKATTTTTNTVPYGASKPKENKNTAPNSVTKSAKKPPTWKRRPKPAHSGVPIPEKMRKMMENYEQLLDPEFALCSF